jgi:opacity protein-like surface antigen
MSSCAVCGDGDCAFNPHWSAKGEYLYVNFGNVSTTLTTNVFPAAGFPVANTMTKREKLNASIAHLGLNYKF